MAPRARLAQQPANPIPAPDATCLLDEMWRNQVMTNRWWCRGGFVWTSVGCSPNSILVVAGALESPQKATSRFTRFLQKPAGLWRGYFLKASFTFSPASFRLDLA